MSVTHTLHAKVGHADVDRDQVILLGRAFKLLQEAAIEHANLFGTGTHALETRAETWVLNRMAVEITRYPKAGESLRVVTWSTGIRGFKGFRDFRVHDASGAGVMVGSSIWLYVSTATGAIVRVPKEIAAGFPVGSEPAWAADLEKRKFPDAGEVGVRCPMTLRYSDFDVNGHVNNAAYLDFVQAALARCRADVRPRTIAIRFARAIPADAAEIEVLLPRDDAGQPFAILREGTLCAEGVLDGGFSTLDFGVSAK